MKSVPVRRYVRRRIIPTIERKYMRPVVPKGYHISRTKGAAAIIKVSEGGGSRITGRVAEDPELFIGYDVWRESAASTMDDLFGFDIVPPTMLRSGRPSPRRAYDPRSMEHIQAARVGLSVQQLIPGTESLSSFLEVDSDDVDSWDSDEATAVFTELVGRDVDKDDLIKIVLFDIILGHSDRHTGNVLIDREVGPDGKRHAYAIDNESILRGDEPDFNWHATWKMVAGLPISFNIRQKLKSVGKGDFYAALAGIETREIENAWRRKQRLQSRQKVPSEW